MDHYVNYYAELRRELPKHASDPEQVPHLLRGHGRVITVTECADGYVITHRARPEEPTVGAPEKFELDQSRRACTVGEVTGRGYPPYSDFDEGEAPSLGKCVPAGTPSPKTSRAGTTSATAGQPV